MNVRPCWGLPFLYGWLFAHGKGTFVRDEPVFPVAGWTGFRDGRLFFRGELGILFLAESLAGK
jgi:hypothetical protein